MKRLIPLLIGAVLLLGACNQNPGEGNDTSVGYVDLPDGRKVLCVSWVGVNAGGLSCDWENAK